MLAGHIRSKEDYLQEEGMSKWIVLMAGVLAAVPAMAQQAPQGQQAPPTVAAFVRQLYMGVQRNIVNSANKMPEENFGLRPGPQMEVRTFGQHLAHVASYQFLWCSQAKGEKNPDFDEESDTRDRGGKKHITQRHGSRPLLARPLKPWFHVRND